MVSLLYYDVFACSYIAILYLTMGVRIKDVNIIFVSMFNMIILRSWIAYSTTMITFAESYNNIWAAIGIALLEMIVCYCIEDIYGYFLHRYMHYNKTLYRVVHQQHHRNKAECFIGAFDVHPVELVAFYFVGLVIGPLAMSHFWSISFLGYSFWLAGATFFIIWSHTGANVRWMPDTTFHYLHHKYYTCNYGTAFSDGLLGTARWS